MIIFAYKIKTTAIVNKDIRPLNWGFAGGRGSSLRDF